MDMFKFLKFQGSIRMLEPSDNFWILEDIGEGASPLVLPKRIYFTRLISLSRREAIDKFNLKKRKYLGTTSMDAELSLISANQARIKPGSIVFDPFVGTGSFLVTSVYFGAITMGGDIDIRVLRGREEGKNILSNFEQYQLEPYLLDLIRFDNAKNDVIRTLPFFDAIITDPPYGVRAGAKKVGVKNPNVKILKDDELPEGWEPHYSQTVPYSVPEVMSDLLDFSARNLVLGGFLVYWFPTTSEYKPDDIPVHPCLELTSNSIQPIALKWKRHLITMKKIIPYDPTIHHISMITQKKDVAHANFSMKIFNDPNRNDDRRNK